jgi:CelD/BcsL family acetyltransferase involved in cellulose biosynthesis
LDLVFLDPTDARWQALLAHPQACSFHHPAWMRLLQESYGYRPFVAAVPDGDGGVRAGLPIMEVHSVLTGRRWVALPFSDYCYPLAVDGAALEALTEGLVSQCTRRGAPCLEVRASLAHDGARAESTCLWHRIPLDDEASTWRRVARMHKGNTRQAERQGVSVVARTDLQAMHAFYHLHTITRRRHGVPVQPWDFFARLATLLATGYGFIALAMKDGQCVAAGVFLHWGETLILKYAASDPERLELRPNNLIYAYALRWGCQNGYRYLDLGKTEVGQDGLCAFKRRWGAQEEPLIYSYVGGEQSRGMSAWLSKGMGMVIRHTPAWVCRASGALLYRHFG